MKHLLFVPSILAAVLVGASAPAARADACNELTYLTFSAPVSLPGVTLPAGTYRFSNPACMSSGHVLRVSSEDGRTVFGTFLAVPYARVQPSDRPEVVFAEMPFGSPEAIKAWFYPGNIVGDELIYPRNEARTVADAREQKVFAVAGRIDSGRS